MLPFDLLVVVIASIGNVFLGLFTLVKNTKSLTNKLFFFFSVTIAVYVFFNYLLLHQSTNEATLFWVRMVMSIALFINLLFYLLVSTFPKQKLQMSRLYFYVSIVFTVLLLPVTQTSLIFQGVIVKGNNIESVPGIGMPLFLLHTLIFLGGGFFLLIKKLRYAQPIEKKQIQLFLLGTIFMFLSILITNLLLVIVFNNSTLVGFLPLYTLVFIGFISYAIIKHRFLDIRLLLVRTVAYILLLLLLGGFYSFAFFFVGATFLHLPFTGLDFIFYGSISLIISFTFQPLRRFTEIITDEVFYKGQYNSQELLKNLSRIMSTTIELKKLTSSILNVVLDEMRITNGAFVLIPKKDNNYIDYIEYSGYKILPVFKTDDIHLFLQEQHVVVFDDLEEGSLKTLMRSLHVSVMLPLLVLNGKIGVLFLGEKASGDTYSEKDLGILDILAPQLSVAIQNAREYEEIRHFNITLREEVDRATKELQEANEKLKQLDKLKDEFVSLASHELRTPMTAIKSYLWMALSGKGGPLSEKLKYYLDRSYASTDRLIKLVNDMLNVSRIESGRIIIAPKQIQLPKVVNDVITEVTPRAQEVGVTIKLLKNPHPIPDVYADADKIREVLLNLIGNSFKFTPQGGTITISMSRNNNMVVTRITDTGKGISQEDMPKLFKKFATLGDKDYLKKQNAQGTGLGLYISKSLVELHGGMIWVHSDGDNTGTTFYFSLKTFESITQK